MNARSLACLICLTTVAFIVLVLVDAQEEVGRAKRISNDNEGQHRTVNGSATQTRQLSSLMNRLRGEISSFTRRNESQSSSTDIDGKSSSLSVVTSMPSGIEGTQQGLNSKSMNKSSVKGDNDDDPEDDDDADDDNDGDDDDADDENDDDDDNADDDVSVLNVKDPDAKIVTDMFGNKIKLQGNQTMLMSSTKGRDFGLLTIKAILLAPLIGLTLKSALIKGLLWSILMYGLHLLVPGLLTTLGLGTGLVGFARQLRPDYAQLMLAHLSSLPNEFQQSLPPSIRRLTQQYRQVFQPVIDSIQSIPEGHCRFRAVCETANYLVEHTQFMSNSIQRLSATVYLNFGTEYSKAWLDGIVGSNCAIKYPQCQSSPISMVASKLAEAVRPINL